VSDFIWVVHESLPDAAPTQVSHQSFDDVWSMRGFVPCDEPVDNVEAPEQGDAKKATARKSTTAPAAPSGDEKE
jgi:hypothetical protein